MEGCRHNWIFQEAYKNCNISGYEHHTAHFKRVDRYYCSNCCEVNEIEKKESVSLPFGGIRKVLNFAPVWY
jgi:hypothetical protein